MRRRVSLTNVNGAVSVVCNSVQKIATTNNMSGAYFKIWAYNQSSGAYGQVDVYGDSVTHH